MSLWELAEPETQEISTGGTGTPTRPPGRPRRRTWVLRSVALVALAGAVLGPGRNLANSWGVPTWSGDGAGTEGPTAEDPELLARFEAARAAATADGVELTIRSGWRSAADQAQLVDDALESYGSAGEAHRYVLPPERSAHVLGTALDVGPREGAAWLEGHAAEFGLCRTYENEWWHVEIVSAIGEPCPAMWPDASHGWE